jgi:transmembrane sensor
MYRHFTKVSDFLKNAEFKTWIDDPNETSNAYWNQFLIQHPEKSDLFYRAKHILSETHQEYLRHAPTEDQVEKIWQNVISQTHANQEVTVPAIKYRFLLSAAAAAILCIIGWITYRPEPTLPITYTYAEQVRPIADHLIENINESNKPIKITLPDQSTVLLQPKSKISYYKTFHDHPKRKVFLSGEAFFNVTSNPEKPFVVFANEICTKVLGTSFNIKAFEDSPEVEVSVKTGKVAVIALPKPGMADNDPQKVILTPNQKILFSRSKESLKKYLVDLPEMVLTDEFLPTQKSFEDVRVTDIFQSISNAYQINIVFDEQVMQSCLLTASFTNETLYEKIDMICKAVEAEFKVVDGNIIISSKGCN